MNKKKLTIEEISKIKELKQQFDDLTGVVGDTEIQIMNLQQENKGYCLGKII